MNQKQSFYKFHHKERQMIAELITVREMSKATGIPAPRIAQWLYKLDRQPLALNQGGEVLYLRSTMELLRKCAAMDSQDNVMMP